MNFFDYIGISKDKFIEEYLHTGLVSESTHDTFPLNLFTYSRKTVHDNAWDSVTSKCRGIVVNRLTDEIVARPFEKFHNYGVTLEDTVFSGDEPYVIEKMDGFMCTQYFWEGQNYIASKGSFHSIHAKWATAELRRHTKDFALGDLYPGKTAVFEGLHRDLRIVVDYGQRQGLVLLALIDKVTGEEINPFQLKAFAEEHGFMTPYVYPLTLAGALESSVKTRMQTEEGYVLTWYRAGATPFRLKLKFTEYLRLHRLVTGVSPRRIWEALSQPHLKAYLDEYLTESTPWFKKWVTKWITAMQGEYDRLWSEAQARYVSVVRDMKPRHFSGEFAENPAAFRKAYATEFNKPENDDCKSILYLMLDGKDVSEAIWKKVRGMTSGSHTMVDAHTT